MERRLRILLPGVLVVLLVFAGTASAGRIVKVGRLANGKTIGLRVGDQLVVTLPGNASTGYLWRVRTLNQTTVKFVSRTYVASAGGKPGSGGKYVLRFRAVGNGTTALKLVYVQGHSKRAAQTFRLTLVVRAPPPPE